MAKFGELTVQLELQQAAFQKGMDSAARTLSKLEANAKKSQGAISSLEQGMSRLATAAKTAAAAWASFKGLEGLAKAGDQIKTLSGSFTALLGSSDRASDMMQRVFALADRTGAPLADAAAGVQRLSIALKDMGATNEQIADIAENFIKLSRIGGASAAEAAGAFQQLGQALAAGKLGGDELRSVLEGAPLVAAEIAKEFGVSTGKLKEMGAAGELSAAKVGNALLKATARIDAAFAALPNTFEQSMNRMATSWTRFAAKFDDASRVGTNLQITLEYISGIFKRWADELDRSDGKFSLIKLAANALRVVFETLAVLLANVAFVAETLARSLAAAATEAYNLLTGAPSAFGAAWKASEEEAAKARRELDAYTQKILQLPNTVAQANRDRRGDELGGGRGGSGLLNNGPPGAGSGAASKEAAALAEQLRKQGEALAASLDPLNAYNQKMAELDKLLKAAAIGSVTYSKAAEQYKIELTAAGDALKASVDPAFAYAIAMRDIDKAYRDSAIEIEHWVALQERAKKAMEEAQKDAKKKTPMGKLQDDVESAINSNMSQFFDNIVEGSMTAAQAFGKMCESIIKDIAKLLAELAAKQAAQFIIKSILGGASGGTKSSGSGPLFNAPSPALFAAPSFDAARSLGVSAFAEPTPIEGMGTGTAGATGPNGPWNVTINNNAPGVDVTTRGRSDGGLDVMVERVRQALTTDVARGGNPFARSLEGAYGLGRGR